MGLFSSKKTTVGYKYFLGMQLIGCHGPIDAVYKFLFDGKVAWEGEVTENETIDVDAEELFGGKDREGGVAGTLDVMMGGLDQPVSAYLQDKQAADVPAYRGVFGWLLRNFYIGNSPYIKMPSVVAKRIHTRTIEGVEQWYDEKAEISEEVAPTEPTFDNAVLDIRFGSDGPGEVNPGFTLHTVDETWWDAEATFVLGNVYRFQAYQTTGSFSNISAVIDGTPNPAYDLVGDFEITVQYGSVGMYSSPTIIFSDMENNEFTSTTTFGMRLFTQNTGTGRDIFFQCPAIIGSFVGGNFPTDGDIHEIRITRVGEELSMYIDDVLQQAAPCSTDTVALGRLVFNGPYQIGSPLPNNWGSANNDFKLIRIANGATPGTGGDMNPAHIIRECLTDPDWGMGYTDADIDDDAFMAAADTLWTEGLGMSLLWDKQIPIDDFIKEVLRHIDASLYVDRSTGLFVLKLIRDDYDPDTLLELDESNVVKVDNWSERRFEELVNSVTVKFSDKTQMWKESSLEVQDTAQIHMQNAVINTTVNYSGFTTKRNAAKVGARDLKTLSSPLASCTITTGPVAKDLTIGSVFKLSWADYGVSGMVMRVTAISFGDGRDNQVRIQCAQDVFSLPDDAYVVVEPGEWVDPNADPTPAQAEMAFEVPYLVTQKTIGASDLSTVMSADAHAGFVAAAAVVPTAGAINATLSTDSGSGYEDQDTMDFCPSALLAGAVGLGDTSVTISDGVNLSGVEVGSIAQCNEELWKVVSIVEPAMTIERGLLDTVPATHSVGDRIFFWGTNAGFDPTTYTAADTVNAKVRPITGRGTLPLASAAALPVVMASRMARPYPPGNVKINGAYYPTAAIDGDINVTWAHRNRLTQTDDDYVSFLDASVTPESGTRYLLELLADDATTVVDSVSGISGTSGTLSPGDAGVGYVRLKSTRGGYSSWQSHLIPVEFIGGTTLLTESGEALLQENGEAILTEEDAPADYGAITVTLEEEASGIVAGNRQVVFFKWTGPDGYADDDGFEVDVPETFNLVAVKGDGFGNPAEYNLLGRYGLTIHLSDEQRRVNDGTRGDLALKAADAGADLYSLERSNGPPYPSDWCQDFSAISAGFDYAIAFPVGEPVYVPAGTDDISLVPGTYPYPPTDMEDGHWTFYGYCNVTYPYPDNVRLYVRKGSGFIEKVTAPRGRHVIVWMDFDTPTEGATYTVTLGGVDFDYVALAGDAVEDIASALSTLVNAHADYTTLYATPNTYFDVTGPDEVEYTYTTSITPP